MDCSLPGSSVHGILQARILEWIAISFSKKKGVKINANKIETTVSSSGKLSNSTQYIQYQSMIEKFPIYSELSN